MKTRKQGNAIVLTVPTKFNIEPDQEFVAIKGEMGSITYVPKVKNIFKEAMDNDEDLRFEDDFKEDNKLVGREEV
ncbi:MAG: AbrB family transcriptional regulator [Alkalibacterium sp.]|nr:AbrB family transcriptional regulator [Alkalibacterium sp.]TVP90397.1 MAG: AbrB family transcriptional regulator [Alkalibacterium sp.]